MIYILSAILILLITGLAFIMGFFLAKGNITISRKLTDEERKVLQESEKEFKSGIDDFNKALNDILNYDDEVGGK